MMLVFPLPRKPVNMVIGIGDTSTMFLVGERRRGWLVEESEVTL